MSTPHLCSATHGNLAIPRSRTTTYRQSYAVSGPTPWNTLPPTMCDASLTLTQFCALLKTTLFYRAYQTLSERLRNNLCCKDCCTNTDIFTYLLMFSVIIFALYFGHSSSISGTVTNNGQPPCFWTLTLLRTVEKLASHVYFCENCIRILSAMLANFKYHSCLL